jgi:hypothetical protein
LVFNDEVEEYDPLPVVLHVIGFTLELVAANASAFLLQRTVSVIAVMLMLPDGGFTLKETESNLEEQLALASKLRS